MRRSEAAALTWGNVELRDNCTALINVRRSKTDQEGEGVTLYIGPQVGEALQAIRSADELIDRNISVFGISPRQIGRSLNAAAKTAGLGEGYTGHRGRVGMAQDLAKTGVKLPALMTAGRCRGSGNTAGNTTEKSPEGTPVLRPGSVQTTSFGGGRISFLQTMESSSYPIYQERSLVPGDLPNLLPGILEQITLTTVPRVEK